ncbi:MAG TPA: C1 family peptidase, partial [Phnomibacter sp.]|nr:C1 family peptidase [Phnomibacter sp.]
MAIRMVDDPRDPDEFRDYDKGGGRGPSGGGGGGIFQLLIPLLFTLFRKPGGLLILALLAVGYFVLNQGGCGGMFSAANADGFATGGVLDPKEYAKAKVYEGLTEDDIRNPLPGFVSLARYAPPRLNQGKQGSCVAWSAAYGAHTILASASTGMPAQQVAFSPAYLYNQIALQGCQGSYLERAMTAMSRKGSVPFNSFPYDENNCTRPVPSALDGVAAQNRIHGFNRLTGGEDVRGMSIRAIKEHLAKNAPVVIGMMVGGSFMEGMIGKKLWQPTERDYSMAGFGGHAMTVIGYDDRLAGGAFQIMNSWGPEWGENGIGWVRYADFKHFNKEAYGIDALPVKGAANIPFDC